MTGSTNLIKKTALEEKKEEERRGEDPKEEREKRGDSPEHERRGNPDPGMEKRQISQAKFGP